MKKWTLLVKSAQYEFFCAKQLHNRKKLSTIFFFLHFSKTAHLVELVDLTQRKKQKQLHRSLKIKGVKFDVNLENSPTIYITICAHRGMFKYGGVVDFRKWFWLVVLWIIQN